MDVKFVEDSVTGLAQEESRKRLVILSDPKPESVSHLKDFLKLESPDKLLLGPLVIRSGEPSKPVPAMYGKEAFVEPAYVSETKFRILGKDPGGESYLVDPRSDLDLRRFIENAVKRSEERLIAQPGKIFAEVATRFVHDSVKYNKDRTLAISDQPGARLGMFLQENTAICSQLAQLLRLILMQKKYLTNTIYFVYPNNLDASGKLAPVGHMAILSKANESDQLMVHDPTWNFSLPFDQAMDEYANGMGGKVDIVDINNSKRKYHIR